MYELWGRGGSPFKENQDGTLSDRAGQKIHLLEDVKSILFELKTDPKWRDTLVAVASSCDEPGWARECIKKYPIGGGHFLRDVFDINCTEIYKSPSGGKKYHLNQISKKSGIDVRDMVFFDNESGNCHTVASIGATVVYTPDGVTRTLFNEVLDKFPSCGNIIGNVGSKRGYW